MSLLAIFAAKLTMAANLDIAALKQQYTTYHDAQRFEGEQLAGLYDPVEYINSIGSKYMRPLLLQMAVSVCGGNLQDSLPAAYAVQLFHNFSLLHDDIMDDAPLRRGKATVHEKWNTATAILSGDVMLVYVYKYLLQLDTPRLKSILDAFTQTSIEVCEGQQLDMDFETQAHVTPENYLRMIRLKTAVLPAAGLKIGAWLAGADDTVAQALYDYGINLGLAFQINDDLLDAYGDPTKVGKQQGGDILQCKKTLLYLRAIERAGEQQESWINEYTQSLDNKVELWKQRMSDCGAEAATRAEADHYTQLAHDALRNSGLSEAQCAPFHHYADTILHRTF